MIEYFISLKIFFHPDKHNSRFSLLLHGLVKHGLFVRLTRRVARLQPLTDILQNPKLFILQLNKMSLVHNLTHKFHYGFKVNETLL